VGVGTGAAGPGRASIEAARRLGAAGSLFPRLELGPARGLVDHVLGAAEQGLILPVWHDELALDDHGGAYTTDGAIKQANRQAETLLLEAERFATLASTLGEPYPREELGEAWRALLRNQSHHVLGGAGAPAVRLEAAREHAELRRLAEPIRQRALEALAARADTRGPGTAIVVVNPLAWARAEEVEAEVPWAGGRAVAVVGPGGVRAAAELVARDAERHTARVRFAATDVPPVGIAVYHVTETPRPGPTPGGTRVHGADGVLENDELRVAVDLRTGCLTSLFDKRSKSELVPSGACANALEAYPDEPGADDARSLDADPGAAPLPFEPGVEVKVLETGPLRASVEVVRRFRSSRFAQRISLASGADRVDVVTDADWHERHVVVKAAFPTTVVSDVATYEVPYGTIDRPTARKPEAPARSDVPALRWADLADTRHGLLVESADKSGYDVRGSVVRLTLLRGPTWPDAHVDAGRARFAYALTPHAGDWRRAGAVRHGYELGWPLLAVTAAPHPGRLPAHHAFARVEPADVMLSALKRGEDDDALVLRLYETTGETATAQLHLAAPVQSAEEIDLLEHRRRPLPVRDGAVTLELAPYEVSSVRVRLAR
jgi:alpha-mannosidase